MNTLSKKNDPIPKSLPEWFWESMIFMVVAFGVFAAAAGTQYFPIA